VLIATQRLEARQHRIIACQHDVDVAGSGKRRSRRLQVPLGLQHIRPGSGNDLANATLTQIAKGLCQVPNGQVRRRPDSRPRVKLLGADETAQQGRFPNPVWADQADMLLVVENKADITDHVTAP
jgi:hypothetical protein